MKKCMCLLLALLLLLSCSTSVLALGVGAGGSVTPAATPTPVSPSPSQPADPNAVTVTVGKRQTIDLTPYFGLGRASFQSADKKIAKVSSKGVVTGVKAGETTVTVTFRDSQQTVIVPVTVTPKPYLKLSASKATLYVGTLDLDKIVLELTPEAYPAELLDTLVWKSSDPEVAIVTGGIVFANDTGRATITVSTPDGKYKASCKVTVKEYAPNRALSGTASCLGLRYGQYLDIWELGYDEVEVGKKTVEYYRYGSDWTECLEYNKKGQLISYMCWDYCGSFSSMLTKVTELMAEVALEHGQPTHTYMWFDEPQTAANLAQMLVTASDVDNYLRASMEQCALTYCYEWRFKDGTSIAVMGYYDDGYTAAVGFGK